MNHHRWASVSAFLRVVAVCLSTVLLATCGEDGPSGPSGSPVIGRVEFQAGPIQSSGFFGPNLPIDRVRILIVRPPDGIVKDTNRAFDPNQQQLRLDLPILLRAAAESLDVTIELRNGTTVLFSGTNRLEARAGPPSGTPAPTIPLVFIGPGAQLTSLQLAPQDSTLGEGDSLEMRVSAFDAQSAPVASFYVGWSSSDTNVATVNGAGIVRGKVPRGTVYIRARSPSTQATPAGVIESTTVTLTPLPASLVKTAGDNQTAPVNSLLPALLEVEVRGSDGLPVPGVAVTFAALSPGATVDSATATSDQAGRARTGATLGGTVGVQTFTATVAGVPAATFSATATVAPAPTWTGAVSTDWHNAGNWNLGFVPGPGDSVTIPAGPANQPMLLTNSVNTAALRVDGTINLNGLQVHASGNVRGTGSMVNGGLGGALFMTGNAVTLSLPGLSNVVVQGQVSLGSNVTITGFLEVQSNGNLNFATNAATVTGDFRTLSGGTIAMTSTQDTLRVGNDALFDGGSTFGTISSGVMFVAGDFTQQATGSARSYAPTGNHLDILNGTGTQNITFATPGAAGSNFETVVLANPSGNIQLQSDIFQAGPVAFATGVPRVVHGNGHTLFVAELLANNATLDNLLVVANNVAITQFDSITFTNYSPAATPLTILHPGAATPFVFNALVFTVTPSSGFYISVTDNAADANTLTINLANPTPAVSGGFIQTAGGAVVNWPAPVGGVITWTGAVSSDWFDPANWSPATVPTAVNDVNFTGIFTNAPVINGNAAIHDLDVSSGRAITLQGGVTLTINGDAVLGGSITGGTVAMSGANGQVSGVFPQLVIAAPYTLGGTLQVNGTLTVNADLTLGGNSVNLFGNLVVQGSGRLVSTHPFDIVDVAGSATFDGISSAGSMTAGFLLLRGGFTQAATSSTSSFAPSGTHHTRLIGQTGTQVLTFATPGGSGFHHLEYLGTGLVSLASDVEVFGTFTDTVPSLFSGGHSLTAGGVEIAGATFDDVRLLVVSTVPTTPVAIDRVVFQNFPGSATQLSITHPGRATPFALSQLTFSAPPSSGFYVGATDNTADANALIIDMVSPTPGAPGGFVQTAGGAVVNWPAGPGTVVTWTGAANTDWNNPANWSPNQVPTTSDSVHIGAGGNQPSLTATSFARALALAGGTLTLNGHALLVTTNFYTSGSTARLVMTNNGDVLQVAGNATFDGGNQLGFMSTGSMVIGGNLTQLATHSPDSYHPSGTQSLVLSGGGPQTITFATPGLVPGSSHLQDVFWTGTTPLTLGSDVYAHGQFTKGSSGNVTVVGNGHQLNVASFLNGSGTITMNNARLAVVQPATNPIGISNVSFINMDPTAVQLQVDHPGPFGPFTLANLAFATVPTTGLYLRATDLNPGDGTPLILDLSNPTPGTPGGFAQSVNGAVINWPAAGPGGIAWTGAVSSDWFDGANWQGGQVPGPTDDVIITTAGFSPQLTAPATVNNIDGQLGAILDYNNFPLTVNGDFTGQAGHGGNGTLVLAGVGLVEGLAPGVIVTGDYGMVGNGLFVGGDLVINGTLDASGNSVNVIMDLVVSGPAAHLRMGNLETTVSVQGDALFDGADASGDLLGGVLTLFGHFTVGNTHSPFAFHADTPLYTSFINSSGTQKITMANPGLAGNRFGRLTLNSPGNYELQSNVFVAGLLETFTVGATVIGNGFTIQTDGAFINGLDLLDARLVVSSSSPGSLVLDHITFANFDPTAVQLTVDHPGDQTAISLQNLDFQTVPTTGLYISAVDNVADLNVLTLNLVNPTPATDGGFTQTAGGAVINWPAAGGGGSITWDGSASTDWFDPANWTTNQVPGPTDDVFIPATANSPVLTTDVVVNSLQTGPGALVDVNGQDLDVTGDFSGIVTSSAPGGTLGLSGIGVTASGSAPNVDLTGDVTVAGSLQVTGNLLVTGSTAHLRMVNPGTTVSVAGDATFQGANATGDMVDGVLAIDGDVIIQTTFSLFPFVAGGNHVTALANGAGQQSIVMPIAGPGGNHFAGLSLAAPGTYVLGTDVSVIGTLVAASTSSVIQGSNSLLSVDNSNVTGLTLDNVRLRFLSTTSVAPVLDNVVFQNQPATALQLEVDHPGSASAIAFNNLVFNSVPTSGFYLLANDNSFAGNTLTIDMVNPSPGTDGGHSLATGGAVINWPAAGGGSATWTGTVDQDWNDPGNWLGGAVPNPGDDVIIPAGMPNYPGLISTEMVGDMVVEPGALVDFVDGSLEVTGDLTGGGSMTGGGPSMTGIGVVLEMADLGSLSVSGFVTLQANLAISGELYVINPTAHFDINGFQLTATGGMYLQNDGTIQMTNPAGQVEIMGQAYFDGGPLNGLLTAGQLTVHGDFTQLNTTNTNSFRPGPSFTTVLAGGALQTITFADSLTSFFSNLQINSPGGVILNSLVRVQSSLSVGNGVQVTANDLSAGGHGFDVVGSVTTGAGSLLELGRLYITGSLSVGGTWNTTSVIFQGASQTAPVLPYQSVFVQSGDVTFAAGTVAMNSLVVSSGSLNLGGRTTVNGDVFITGGTLRPSSRTLNIVGALNVQNTGTLTMQNALDSVLVTGFTGFGGGSTSGLLTAGVLQVGGSFTQTAGTSNTSFAASGTHTTILGAGAVRVVNFATPGTGGAGSHFANLDVTPASGGLTLSNDIVVDGLLTSLPTAGSGPTITGGASQRKVTVLGLSVSRASGTSLTFDNAPLVVNEQGTARTQTFNRAVFTGFPTTATSTILMDMTMAGSGSPRPVTFTAPTVQTSLGAGGLYARLVSSNGPLQVTLTISGSNDPTGGPSRSDPAFGNTVNGARIVWQ